MSPNPATLPDPPLYTRASFMLRPKSGAQVFNNQRKVAHALSSSPIAKYVLKGELCSLGNSSALVIQVYEHNLLKVPVLYEPSFTLGDWEVT